MTFARLYGAICPTLLMKTVEWDLKRWVFLVEIAQRKLVAVNVYAVNDITNDYRDPVIGKVVGDRHDRKRIFYSLLRDKVQRYKDRR